MIELTEQQRRDIADGHEVRVSAPELPQPCVLVRADVYERRTSARPQSQNCAEIPEGIRASQEAYWRDLPGLLQVKNYEHQWVAYHRDERIGIAKKDVDLLRAIARRGIPNDQYYIDTIQPREQAPWGEEEVEVVQPHFFDS